MNAPAKTPLSLGLATLLCLHEHHVLHPAVTMQDDAHGRCCNGCYGRAMAIWEAVNETGYASAEGAASELRRRPHATHAEVMEAAQREAQTCLDELVADAIAAQSLIDETGK